MVVAGGCGSDDDSTPVNAPANAPVEAAADPGLKHIYGLGIEGALAGIHGLTTDVAYMTDLEDDIGAHRAAYVGAAVTEIATVRAVLSGPLQG